MAGENDFTEVIALLGENSETEDILNSSMDNYEKGLYAGIAVREVSGDLPKMKLGDIHIVQRDRNTIELIDTHEGGDRSFLQEGFLTYLERNEYDEDVIEGFNDASEYCLELDGDYVLK